MIVTCAAAFRAEFSPGKYPPRHAPTARGAFLVAPASAALATESTVDNRYMAAAPTLDLARARTQHDALARALGDDLPVVTFAGDPACPDGLFPNNVFATARGRFIVGRMRHAVRQREARRDDIRRFLRDMLGYAEIDLSREAFVAELTGALVIDRARGIGYCGLSERCDLAGARAMHAAFGLHLTFAFPLAAGEYHTNVVLAVLGDRAALVATDGFANADDAQAIADVYGGGAIALDAAQKNAFSGNAIALSPRRAWLSARGAEALHATQLAVLEKRGFQLGCVALDEIEKAGGSLRCCVAEIF